MRPKSRMKLKPSTILLAITCITNNDQSNKGGVALYIKNSIPVMVKPVQTIIRNGIETIFADLNTPSGIITVGLVYKRSVDISTENCLHSTRRNNFFP